MALRYEPADSVARLAALEPSAGSGPSRAADATRLVPNLHEGDQTTAGPDPGRGPRPRTPPGRGPDLADGQSGGCANWFGTFQDLDRLVFVEHLVVGRLQFCCARIRRRQVRPVQI